MRHIHRDSPLGFDPIILGLTHGARVAPVRPWAWATSRRHEPRGTFTDGPRVDGRDVAAERADVHDNACRCDDCGRQRASYEQDSMAALDGIRRQCEGLKRTARTCSDASLADWHRVMRAGQRLYATHALLDSRAAVNLQCQMLADAYETAAMIVLARMIRLAKGVAADVPERDPVVRVRDDNAALFVCEHEGCNCQ